MSLSSPLICITCGIIWWKKVFCTPPWCATRA